MEVHLYNVMWFQIWSWDLEFVLTWCRISDFWRKLWKTIISTVLNFIWPDLEGGLPASKSFKSGIFFCGMDLWWYPPWQPGDQSESIKHKAILSKLSNDYYSILNCSDNPELSLRQEIGCADSEFSRFTIMFLCVETLWCATHPNAWCCACKDWWSLVSYYRISPSGVVLT